MAAAATIPYLSVDEYLHTDYEPDADYVDGVLEERDVGEWDHADLQGELIALFRSHGKEWGVRTVPEIRIQTSPTRFRVADVGVVSASAPREQIVRTPPLLCIEILSPEDRLSRSRRKYNDYLSMGVREVWILDPAERIAHVMRPDGVSIEHREGALRLENTAIEIDIVKLFSILDLS